MGGNTGRQFHLRQKQNRDSRPKRKGAGILLSEEERSEEAVKSFIQVSSSGSLFTFSQLSGLFAHT